MLGRQLRSEPSQSYCYTLKLCSPPASRLPEVIPGHPTCQLELAMHSVREAVEPMLNILSRWVDARWMQRGRSNHACVRWYGATPSQAQNMNDAKTVLLWLQEHLRCFC
ncbi:uncharacterized protein CC84DRAFT_564107 [Paraphaeosphaeria sporulosa]|uniref:Uncharacterized protein n=1 Tax=Paraphaeosphaeria sporulosa TaxID=1460663 RepID=A0A177CM11_9PLEO|nr:uncharacterized protein CC84DRAFT_564107 [Paraphaeosphaeria sporulosa]OAG08291.1 hypothetical protein CC84DRAFT_564107 [Paraphaeosphaeria sporulosa]